MSRRRKNKPGPPSMAEEAGEPTVMFSMMLRKSQHDYITNQAMPAAEFMRFLIEISKIYTDIMLGEGINTYKITQDQAQAIVAANEEFMAVVGRMAVAERLKIPEDIEELISLEEEE